MGSFVSLNDSELLSSNSCSRESSGDKVLLDEFGQGFLIELRLELLQHIRKLCVLWLIKDL